MRIDILHHWKTKPQEQVTIPGGLSVVHNALETWRVNHLVFLSEVLHLA